MSEKSKDGWFYGRFVNLAQSHPPVVTDCSNWEPDIPADQWTYGRFVNLAQSHPPVVTDCSNWDPLPVWLEIRVQFEAEADPAAVEALTVKMIHAAAAAPELGLTYDLGRSRVDGEDVIVALTPTNPAGAQERLAAIVRAIEAALVESAAVEKPKLADAQWCTAA
ncbi:MAG TPA: hypothetical protein VH092_32300 [Urbifossiella sp.]|jgi:hypothetical protein|nr:hypothetical protein [Urbifossiella sp.]